MADPFANPLISRQGDLGEYEDKPFEGYPIYFDPSSVNYGQEPDDVEGGNPIEDFWWFKRLYDLYRPESYEDNADRIERQEAVNRWLEAAYQYERGLINEEELRAVDTEALDDIDGWSEYVEAVIAGEPIDGDPADETPVEDPPAEEPPAEEPAEETDWYQRILDILGGLGDGTGGMINWPNGIFIPGGGIGGDIGGDTPSEPPPEDSSGTNDTTGDNTGGNTTSGGTDTSGSNDNSGDNSGGTVGDNSGTTGGTDTSGSNSGGSDAGSDGSPQAGSACVTADGKPGVVIMGPDGPICVSTTGSGNDPVGQEDGRCDCGGGVKGQWNPESQKCDCPSISVPTSGGSDEPSGISTVSDLLGSLGGLFGGSGATTLGTKGSSETTNGPLFPVNVGKGYQKKPTEDRPIAGWLSEIAKEFKP